jgi:hypothetical protein
VIAIQEAQKRLTALRELLLGLGRDWSVILTDPVEDDRGDDERLAFLFDKSRVEVDGLACELVVPYSWSKAKRPKTGIAAIALDRQFARTPYAVTFKRRSAIFTLVTLHVYWGSKSDQDVDEHAKELSSIATWLKEWARDPDTWDQNLICLGDFNIDRSGSALWQAFTSTNLTTPVELQSPNRQVGGSRSSTSMTRSPGSPRRGTAQSRCSRWATPTAPGCSIGASPPSPTPGSPGSRSPSGSPTTTHSGSSSWCRSHREAQPWSWAASLPGSPGRS